MLFDDNSSESTKILSITFTTQSNRPPQVLRRMIHEVHRRKVDSLN